jgi:hypothetical protein
MTRLLVSMVVLVTGATAAHAQDDGPAFRPHRFVISGGLAWLGGYGIGTSTAALRRNETGTPTPSGFTLFNADGAIERANGAAARVGFAVTPTFAFEIGASYSRPVVAVGISADREAGDVPRLADQQLRQYVIDASGMWQIQQLSFGTRARPYVTAGGGYLRQLDADRVRAVTGKIFHVGGGVRYWLRGGDAAHRALGLRAEARAEFRGGGFDFEEKTRVFPTLNLFLFFGF